MRKVWRHRTCIWGVVLTVQRRTIPSPLPQVRQEGTGKGRPVPALPVGPVMTREEALAQARTADILARPVAWRGAGWAYGYDIIHEWVLHDPDGAVPVPPARGPESLPWSEWETVAGSALEEGVIHGHVALGELWPGRPFAGAALLRSEPLPAHLKALGAKAEGTTRLPSKIHLLVKYWTGWEHAPWCPCRARAVRT